MKRQGGACREVHVERGVLLQEQLSCNKKVKEHKQHKER